jgi:hypothetical protein
MYIYTYIYTYICKHVLTLTLTDNRSCGEKNAAPLTVRDSKKQLAIAIALSLQHDRQMNGETNPNASPNPSSNPNANLSLQHERPMNVETEGLDTADSKQNIEEHMNDVSETCDMDSTYVRASDTIINGDSDEKMLNNHTEDIICDKNNDNNDNNDINNCSSSSSSSSNNCSNYKNDISSSSIENISIGIENVSTIEDVRTTECDDINIKEDSDKSITARRYIYMYICMYVYI